MKPSMIGNRDTGRLQGQALFAIWLLLAVLPALFLQFIIDRWLDQQEEILLGQARRQAATEMRNFQNDLEIPRALDLAYRRVRREFSLYHTSSQREEEVIRRFQGFNDQDFTRFRESVRQAAGADPSILILTDHTRGRRFTWTAPGRHLGSSPEHSAQILDQMLLPYIRRPFSIPDPEHRIMAEARQVSEQHLGIGVLLFGFGKYTKSFNPLFGGPGLAYGTNYFSTLPRPPHKPLRPAATAFIIFHAGDLNQEHLGRQALKIRGVPGLRREIGYQRASILPTIVHDGEDQLLIDTAPTAFPRSALERITPRLGESRGKSVVLAVRISRQTWTHPFRRHLPLVHLFLFIAVSGAGLASGHLFLNGFPGWAGLPGKTLVGFALGALVPLSGLCLVTAAWLFSQESSRPVRVVAHMQQRLERFENCFGILNRNWSRRAHPFQVAFSRHLEDPQRTKGLMERAIASECGNLGRTVMMFPAGKQEATMLSDYSTTTHQQLFPMIGAFVFDLMRELKLRPEEDANSAVTGNFITLAQSIADQYVDSSFARLLTAQAGLVQPSLFGNFHEQQGVLFLPGLLEGDPPRGMLMIMASHRAGIVPFLTGISNRSLRMGERFKGHSISYSFFEIHTVEPPTISRLRLSEDALYQREGFSIAERTLRERGDRIETVIEDGQTSLIASRRLAQSPYIGIAKAKPHHRSFTETLRFPLLLFGALLGLWLGVTLSASFLLTRQMPSFLEATRETAAGRFDWQLSVPTADEFGDLAKVFNAMANGLGERAKMSRFVSDEVLETVRRDDQAMLRPGWEQARVAVLFSDIRGFTTLSETHSPETIVAMLNDYFTAMELPIREQRGSINSLIGDAILAVFSPKPGLEAPELRACKAALAMQRALALFNDERRAAGQFTVSTGVGIAVGEAMCGHIGSETGRLAHTVLGDTADRAPRLEAVSRKTGGSGIIIDAEVWRAVATLAQAQRVPTQLLPSDLAENEVWELETGG